MGFSAVRPFLLEWLVLLGDELLQLGPEAVRLAQDPASPFSSGFFDLPINTLQTISRPSLRVE
jgi:hypothetical protein